MKKHIVRQGECLSSIAKKYGFGNYECIYNAPENEKLRAERPNPHILCPGDEVLIPNHREKTVEIETGKPHRFRMPSKRTALHIRVNHESPHRFVLNVGDVKMDGVTNRDAPLEVNIEPDAETGELTIWPDAFGSPEAAGNAAFHWRLLIGHLDPIETISGVQARLENLGYLPGPIDGINGPRTRYALKIFQRDNPPLKANGLCDVQTLEALKSKHGC